MAGTLSGVRVIDVSIGAVGPWSTMLLAMLGADVIKIEPPRGDIMRAIPPTKGGISTSWMHCNLGKRSICLDLKRENHRDAALKLIQQADILVENMRPGTADRLVIGYKVASQLNPRLIYCSASAYGQKGPWRNVGGADLLMQAFGGSVSVSGTEGGRGELLRYVAHSDLTTSSYITGAVLLALYARERTGRGQKVETSMLEAWLDVQATRLAEYYVTGRVPRRAGTIVPTTAPHEAFLAADGEYICVGITTEAQWASLCGALGVPALCDDPRFRTNPLRVKSRDVLAVLLAPLFTGRSSSEWVDILHRRRGVPCSTLWTREQVQASAHVRGNDQIQSVESPSGPLWVAGPPWAFDGIKGRASSPPRPGEHTEEVMREIGHELDEVVYTAEVVESTF